MPFLNFSLRAVGFGGTVVSFHGIDAASPISEVLAYFIHRLSLEHSAQSLEGMISSSMSLVLDDGFTIQPLPSDADATVGEGLAILHDGTHAGRVGWLYGNNTRQTLQVINKIIPPHSSSSYQQFRHHQPAAETMNVTVAAVDLALGTIGDLKILLGQEVGIGPSEILLIDEEHQDVANDKPLFPYLKQTGEGILRMTRREGMLVSVKIHEKMVNLSRLPFIATIEDVARRLYSVFKIQVVGFELLDQRSSKGNFAGLLDNTQQLMELTPDGMTVSLLGVTEPYMATPHLGAPQLQEITTTSDKQALQGSSFRPLPFEVTARVTLVGIPNQPVLEIQLPEDGHFSVLDLKAFLTENRFVLPQNNVIVSHGRQLLHDECRLGTLVQRPPTSSGASSPGRERSREGVDRMFLHLYAVVQP